MTRHGNPISKLSIRNKLHHGITYSSRFEEWEACRTMGLDIERWETGEPKPYTKELKGYAIARYRVRNMIESHVQDAAVDRAKRDAKRKRR